MFKALAFQILCIVRSKLDFVFSWPNCALNLLSTNESHKLEKSLSSCFSISVTFLCWKTMHKVMNDRQQLGASHLCKAKTGVGLEWILGGTPHIRFNGLE